jgi:hypothetical protein
MATADTRKPRLIWEGKYLSSLTASAWSKTVVAVERGRSRRVPYHKYVANQLVADALKGDRSAIKFIASHVDDLIASARPPTPRFKPMKPMSAYSAEELARVDRHLERFTRAAEAFAELHDYVSAYGPLPKGALERMGLTIPKTWDEFLERDD